MIYTTSSQKMLSVCCCVRLGYYPHSGLVLKSEAQAGMEQTGRQTTDER